MTVVFPAISKLPCDLHLIIRTQGTVESLDPDTLQLVTYEVECSRDYWVARCSGDTAYIRENISFIDATNQQDLPSLRTTALYALDRTTRKNIPGYGDQDRYGYWCFPLFVEKGKDYPVWFTGNPTTLDGKYVGEEDFMGLRVLVYEFSTPEEGLTVPKGLFTPEMKIHQWLEMKLEPLSGTGVYFQGSTRRTTMIPVPDDLFPNTGPVEFVEMTVYSDHLTYAPETTDKLVSDAKYYAWMLPLAGTYVPWASIGTGLVLALVGGILIARRRPTPTPPELPVDNSGGTKP